MACFLAADAAADASNRGGARTVSRAMQGRRVAYLAAAGVLTDASLRGWRERGRGGEGEGEGGGTPSDEERGVNDAREAR